MTVLLFRRGYNRKEILQKNTKSSKNPDPVCKVRPCVVSKREAFHGIDSFHDGPT